MAEFKESNYKHNALRLAEERNAMFAAIIDSSEDAVIKYGKDVKSPSASIQGPKVMLIDESAGSGGDMLPWMFKKFKMGKLVGTRTWGGPVGVLDMPELLDGGKITAPNWGVWTEDGWQIENIGVMPDIEVEQLPHQVINGEDPQLQKAIETVLKELEMNPPVEPLRPAYPVKVLTTRN